MDVLSQEDLITYESLVQEATREYRYIQDSKRWKPAISEIKVSRTTLTTKGIHGGHLTVNQQGSEAV